MSKHAVKAAAEHLRALALGYPEAVEEFPWGHSAIKVRGKAFLFMSGEGGRLGLSCKLPASHGAALLLPFASPTGYGLGKSGWVSAEFAPGTAPPLDLLAEWIDESYRAVAPKKLAALVAARRTAGDVSKDMLNGLGAKKPVPAGMSSEAGAKKAAKAGAKKAAARRAGAKKTARAAAKKATATTTAARRAGAKAARRPARRAP